jgi:hypothetical protein
MYRVIGEATVLRENGYKYTVLHDIWANQLVWYGHLKRMNEERLPKKIRIFLFNVIFNLRSIRFEKIHNQNFLCFLVSYSAYVHCLSHLPTFTPQ